MRLILDEGLPLRAAGLLRKSGIDASHVLELKMGGASDAKILERAKADGAVVATLDADFHRILAVTGAGGPSVIRVRSEGVHFQQLAVLLLNVLQQAGPELVSGAAVSVSTRRFRLRRLPLRSSLISQGE